MKSIALAAALVALAAPAFAQDAPTAPAAPETRSAAPARWSGLTVTEITGRLTAAGWNGDRRFVKAFYAAPETEGADPQAVAQYDVLLSPGAGPQQLDDPIQVWRSLAVDLGRTVATPQPAAATPPAR